MSDQQQTQKIDNKLRRVTDPFGNLMVDLFHYIALFAIGGAIFWSAVMAFMQMVAQGGASIADILLLFIYLELGAMVGIYFKTNHMPTRFLIYVGITALTGIELFYITGSILLLALANLVVRYGSNRFPAGAPGIEARSDE